MQTIEASLHEATLGAETFTDFDYADDVSLLAEMLEVLLLSLDVPVEGRSQSFRP